MFKKKKLTKKGQVWGMDLIIAVSIFSFALTGFYFYALNEQGSSEETIESLLYYAREISNILLSEGYPEDWNSTNVIEMGILTDKKINKTKLEKFYNLTQTESGYAKTKSLFNTAHDYYFFLEEDLIFGAVTVEGIGKPGITKDTISASNLVKINRIVVYKNKIMTAELYVWDE